MAADHVGQIIESFENYKKNLRAEEGNIGSLRTYNVVLEVQG